jgi:16S rRNA G966 N2-methylase RsmD
MLQGPYNIVLMDPPYKDTGIGVVIEQLAASGLVGEETPVVITHSSRFKLEQRYGTLTIKREYRHADSTIAIYRKEQSS